MALHGLIAPILNTDGHRVLLLIFDLLLRSCGSIRRQPTIRREEEFEEDRHSGEYYSGEEFYEDEGMLSGDRYHHGTVDRGLRVIRINVSHSMKMRQNTLSNLFNSSY